MFLRKIFSSNNRFTWVIVDLIIVITGVYTAFSLQNYAENKKVGQERSRVLSALKYEMEFFRYRMFETTLGMKGSLEEYRKIKDNGTYVDFSDYRFIEPQYDYQTIKYALDLQNTAIVDFELYEVLQNLYVEIKKIEHVERLLTETAIRYKSIPTSIDKSSTGHQLLFSENMDNFNRLLILINDRGNIAGRIATASTDALPIVNERLGSERTREIEEDIIVSNVHIMQNDAQALQIIKKFFPHYSEEEIKQFIEKSKNP